jgi:hypothetical protein
LPSAVKPTRLAPPSEIAADLAALGGEFPEVALDLAERNVSVVTEPIELEGIALGRFRICLYWLQLYQTRAYEVIALEPTPASENDAVTHPHVYDKLLCPGEGALPIQAALAEGRMWDFFTLVNQILQTYNAGSAHIPLNRWAGTMLYGHVRPLRRLLGRRLFRQPGRPRPDARAVRQDLDSSPSGQFAVAQQHRRSDIRQMFWCCGLVDHVHSGGWRSHVCPLAPPSRARRQLIASS